MIIEAPTAAAIPALRTLWQEAFGDGDAFLDAFFSTAFSSARSRCITENGRVLSALYWFDCTYREGKLAYLYAIATAKDARGRGLCRTLMEHTHRYLQSLGYVGTVLLPASLSLYDYYRRLGYTDCTSVHTFEATASASPISTCVIDKAEYAALRRRYLPNGAVLQENENLDFWATQAAFFAADGAILTAFVQDGSLVCREILGDLSLAPHILASINCSTGSFRTFGATTPFTLWHPFSPISPPSYFGLTFD